MKGKYFYIFIFLFFLSFLSIQIETVMGGSEQEEPDREERDLVIINMNEYTFEPDEVYLREGVEAEISIKNEGKEMHEFVTEYPINGSVRIGGVIVEAYGIAELEIESGVSAVITFTPEEKGRFAFSCRAKEPKDHYKEGMRGILEVR